MNDAVQPNKLTAEDIQCVIYARLGLSAKLIGKRTGLTTGQVYRKLNFFGVKLFDYRHGRTEFSQRMITAADEHRERLLDDVRVAVAKFLPTPPAPPPQQ